jgi:hypothetical protein
MPGGTGVGAEALKAKIRVGGVRPIVRRANARKRQPLVAQSARLNEKINQAMRELMALGPVRPRLLGDDTIELRPAPSAPDLSLKVSEIFERAGVRELRPWIWGFETASPRSTRPVPMRSLVAAALFGAMVGALVASLKRRPGPRSRLAKHQPAP